MSVTMKWFPLAIALSLGTTAAVADEAGTAHAHDHDRHDALVHSFVLRFPQPFVWGEFAEAMDVLLSTCGDRILRVKGLVGVVGESAPRVVRPSAVDPAAMVSRASAMHGSAPRVVPGTGLPGRPAAPRRSFRARVFRREG